jgi:hypothetical protein
MNIILEKAFDNLMLVNIIFQPLIPNKVMYITKYSTTLTSTIFKQNC